MSKEGVIRGKQQGIGCASFVSMKVDTTPTECILDVNDGTFR
jgi:hypothetical protein